MSFVSCWLFFVQPRDLVGDVDRRILVHEAQLVDLRLQLGDRLLEIEEGLLHRCGAIGGIAHSIALACRRRTPHAGAVLR